MPIKDAKMNNLIIFFSMLTAAKTHERHGFCGAFFKASWVVLFVASLYPLVNNGHVQTPHFSLKTSCIYVCFFRLFYAVGINIFPFFFVFITLWFPNTRNRFTKFDEIRRGHWHRRVANTWWLFCASSFFFFTDAFVEGTTFSEVKYF